MTGTFSLNNQFATVLFDSGADFSFISTKFAPLLNMEPCIVNPIYVIEIADGESVKVDRIIHDCKLELGNSLFTIDLIPLGHESFDVIVGMDWLSKNKAVIVCHEKVVEIPIKKGGILRVHGERTLGAAKALMNAKIDEPRISDIPVVRDFNDVFPEDLLGLPLQRQVDFCIDLVPRATPVAKSPVERKANVNKYLPELLLQLPNDSQTIAEILKQHEEKRIQRKQAANLAVQKEQEEQAAQSFTPYWNFPMIDDEHTIQYRLYLERSSKSITPDLPTEDSLCMGDEHLCTIPEKESDEFIKSSVEDLVPIPSESEDILESDSDCDLPSCDDLFSIDVPRDDSMTFSNPLFNSNDDFTSSDDDSLSDEDVPEDDIECKDSYDSNLDESTFLVIPLSDSNKDECFTPSDDIELLLHHDPSISINDWKKILYDAPIDDLITEDKVCPDFEGSCARCFVHHSLALQILSMLILGMQSISILNKRL
ncbi:putative reverse transcriptase domain-containing protein [Tanacetum coccineum]